MAGAAPITASAAAKGGTAPRPLRLALAGGGTGGHLVPGLHLLEQAQGLEGEGQGKGGPGLADVLWFTSGRPVEARVLAALPERIGRAPVEIHPLILEPPGGGAPGLARLGLRLAPSVLRARSHLRAHRSGVLLALGGFAAAPAVIAARTLGLPVALLEINAASGRATRVLSPLARRVFHAWPSTSPRPGGDGRHRLVGPPLSPRLAPAGDARDRARARSRMGLPGSAPLLIILGGSQGAGALNAFVRAHRATLQGPGVSVLHQVGPGRAQEGAAPRPGYRVVEYLDDVPAALAAAELVLCRGGASTLAEVGAVGVPAWVVPYPHHADRHQERNARQLGDGVRVVEEGALGADLAGELARLCGPRGVPQRDRMRGALAGRVPADAARRILADLADLANLADVANAANPAASAGPARGDP